MIWAREPTVILFFILSRFSDFGTTTIPFSTPQLSATWPSVAPCFLAIRTTSSSVRRGDTEPGWGCPMGEYAVITIPCCLHSLRSPNLGKHGCSSTWLTAGTTVVVLSRDSMSGTPKLDTPSARTLPVARSFVISAQVSWYVGDWSGFKVFPKNVPSVAWGQCMRYKSMYSISRALRDFSKASATRWWSLLFLYDC